LPGAASAEPANAWWQRFFNCGDQPMAVEVINICDQPARFVNGFED